MRTSGPDLQCELVTPGEKTAIAERLGQIRCAATPTRRSGWRPHRPQPRRRRRVAHGPVGAGRGGNVYRAEILYRAGVNPYRMGRDLGSGTWSTMWDDLRWLMRDGLRRRRIITTLPADRDSPGRRVLRDDAHYVYRRAGLPCRRCGTEIRTAVMVARNLFWCPVCQAV